MALGTLKMFTSNFMTLKTFGITSIEILQNLRVTEIIIKRQIF